MWRRGGRGRGREAHPHPPKRACPAVKKETLSASVSVAGLLCTNSEGITVAPQSLVFVFDSNNVAHKTLILKKLAGAKKDWDKTAGASCFIFRASCEAGAVPSVVGGLTHGFKSFTVKKN